MRALAVGVAGAAAFAASLTFIPDAAACGGCFVPAQVGPPTVVSGHRMVMSISKTQTVLWDQIQYQGDPEEFAWVLPVKAGARVEESTDAFFEALEATTRVTVRSQELSCAPTDSGCGFGCGDDAAAGSDGGYTGSEGGVDVVHQGSVGPYETVTLSTSTPGALNAWLQDHGYNVDAESQPVIDQYVAEGFDFIALRLQPGQGVAQMTPVRIVMPGGGMTLPLRMVAIGTGAVTPLVLYFIGEGRHRVENFPEVTFPTSDLIWDFKAQTSNYQQLRNTLMKKDGGGSFLVSFASPSVFRARATGSTTEPPTTTPSLQTVYANQAKANGEAGLSCSISGASGTNPVVSTCPAGEPFDSAACTAAAQNEVDARKWGCPGAWDLSTALVGMRTDSVWVTRVEAELPRSALATDLVVGAGPQTGVSNQLVATRHINADTVCPGGAVVVPAWDRPSRPRTLRMAPYVIGGALLLLLLRRRARAARPGARLDMVGADD
jgi:hypothetical protein